MACPLELETINGGPVVAKRHGPVTFVAAAHNSPVAGKCFFLFVENGFGETLLAGGNGSASVAICVTPLNIKLPLPMGNILCDRLPKSATTELEEMWRSAASAVRGAVGYN